MKSLKMVPLLLSTLAFNGAAHAGWLDNLSNKTEPQVTAPQTQNNDLVSTVMSQLGLNQNQAEGGLGSLLSLAQSTLGDESFAPIAAAIPGADMLLGAAPQADNGSGMSGLLSQAGDLGASLQGGAQVYDAFEKLGISKQLAMPMVDIVKSYLDTNAGAGTSDLLLQGLGAIL